MSMFLKSALYYQRMGFSVIPIIPREKKAAIEWKEFQTRIATDEEITEWALQWPNANIGIVTGKISNLFVVDLDKYKPEYDPAIELEHFDTLSTPTVLSPKGGNHLYFCYQDGLTIASGVFPAVDIRGEGGYIIAPPSVNGTGKPYEWIVPLEGITLSALPASFLASILNKTSTLYSKKMDSIRTPDICTSPSLSSNVHQVHQSLSEGNRNSAIFTVAIGLARGKCDFGLAKQTIEILAKNANPPYDLKEAYESLKSAYNRIEKGERNIKEEVREYILGQKSLLEVHLKTTECLSSLSLYTRLEKKAAYTALWFFCNEEKLLEKQEGTRGLFRILDSKIDDALMDLTTEAEIQEVDVRLPLNLKSKCIISPGNIIVISGSKSSGKTALCMNIAWLNQDRFEVNYMNSEAHETEFKKRMKKFGPLNKWHIKGYKCHTNFEDYIVPDKHKLYIVDYLEIHENFYEIGKHIRKIHEKLGDSICIIAIQMKAGADLGRGGDFSAEKSRLYLTMDFVPSALKTRVTIYDAKEPRHEENVRGMFQMVKIINGCTLDGESDWHR